MQSGERKPYPCYFISMGLEKPEKKVHYWLDMEFGLGTNYNYATTDTYTNEPATVSGKTGFEYTLRYNLAYFLADNSKENVKLLPFIQIGLGYMSSVSLSHKPTINPADALISKHPAEINSNITYGGGGGLLYNISTRLGVRVSATYNGLTSTRSNEVHQFYPIANHPALNLAVRFRMDKNE
jgi:hypothetical protein